MSSAQKLWSYQCEWDGCGKVGNKAIHPLLRMDANYWIPFNGRPSRAFQPSRPTTASIRINVLVLATTSLAARLFMTMGR